MEISINTAHCFYSPDFPSQQLFCGQMHRRSGFFVRPPPRFQRLAGGLRLQVSTGRMSDLIRISSSISKCMTSASGR